MADLPTESRAAIEKAVRVALQAAITGAVPAAANTYTRRLDPRNQNHWQRSVSAKAGSRQTRRALFILFSGIEGRNVPELCHSGTLTYRIRCMEQFHDGNDVDNSNDSFVQVMLDAIDALYASSNLGYRNCRVQRAEIVSRPLLDPFETGLGVLAHRGDIEVEVRVN